MKRLLQTITISFVILVSYYVWPSRPSKELMERIPTELKEYGAEFNNAQYAILVDYSKPVFKKRLWVLELKTKKIIINSHVSHAWKSGILWARNFSNIKGSYLSSKGTFKTLYGYTSRFGNNTQNTGMRIKGLEKGINDNVLDRAIVFHPGLPFWSQGCFMTWPETNKKVIELTAEGNLILVNN